MKHRREPNKIFTLWRDASLFLQIQPAHYQWWN